MAIKIVKEPDIYLTEGEHSRLMKEYADFIRYHAHPPTFEEFVRSKKQHDAPRWKDLEKVPKGGA